MTTKDEALKLALEALEETRNALAWFYDSYPQDVTKKGNELLPHVETVLTAIREALAEQPAQQELKRIRSIISAVTGFEDDDEEYLRDAVKALNQLIDAQPAIKQDLTPEQPAQQQAPASAGVEPHCYMDEYGNVRGSYEYWMECEGGWFPVYTSPQPAPVAKPHEQQDYWQEEARRYAQNADFWRGKYESATAQQQEPVTWMHTNAIGHVYFRKNPQDKTLNPVPLYTSPPASKPWVGLTSEEVYACDQESGLPQREITTGDLQAFAQCIEAKLKEKNA